MAKKTGGLILGILAAGVTAALVLRETPSTAAPTSAQAPSWWPSSVPFPATAPPGWPTGMAWPPPPGTPQPTGFVPMPMTAPVSPVPSSPALPGPAAVACKLDANMPSDLQAIVTSVVTGPDQSDPTSLDALIQLLNQNQMPLGAALVQKRKDAGGPIQC